MCPRKAISQKRLLKAGQAGLSIISALFMLLLMAALAAFMLTFSTVQSVTQAQDIQGSRAYWAAKSGLEWGAYRVINDNACFASTPLTVSGFAVTVDCALSGPYNEGVGTVNVFQITATASEGTIGTPGFVERQLRATVAK